MQGLCKAYLSCKLEMCDGLCQRCDWSSDNSFIMSLLVSMSEITVCLFYAFLCWASSAGGLHEGLCRSEFIVSSDAQHYSNVPFFLDKQLSQALGLCISCCLTPGITLMSPSLSINNYPKRWGCAVYCVCLRQFTGLGWHFLLKWRRKFGFGAIGDCRYISFLTFFLTIEPPVSVDHCTGVGIRDQAKMLKQNAFTLHNERMFIVEIIIIVHRWWQWNWANLKILV